MMVTFFARSVTILILLLVCEIVKGEVEVPFFKRTDCGDLCTRVRCANAKANDCHQSTQVFVKRDGDCYCCDTCADRAAVPSIIDKKCKRDYCNLVDCRNFTAKECFDKGMAFTPRDNDCQCCDSCV